MLDQLTTLRKTSVLLRHLDDAQLERLADSLQVCTLREGATLIAQSDADGCVYLLLEGTLEVSHEDTNSDGQSLATIEPGGLIGEVAGLYDGRRTSTVKALGDARLARFERAAFADFLDAHPAVAADVSELVLQRLRRSQLAVHLRRLFGQLSQELLQALEKQARWRFVPGGEVLFRQGEDADCAYVVISGRLRVRVYHEDGRLRHINEIGRGETLGEMALLAQTARSATVHALRDCSLAAFDRADFARLVDRYPQIMRPVTEVIVQRLVQASGRPAVPTARGLTIALAAAREGYPIDRFSRAFVAALERLGATEHLSSRRVDEALGQPGLAQAGERDPGNMRLAPWLLEREEKRRYVVYEADAQRNPWTARCLRQADHVVVVADAGDEPGPGRWAAMASRDRDDETRPRTSLVLLNDGSVPAGTSRWLEHGSFDQHFHICRDSDVQVDRLARSVSGCAVGLVLGGGGARGFAHIGVLRAMHELGIHVDMIGGTSMGAVVAGLHALGHDAREIQSVCKQAFADLLDYTFPAVALLRGQRIGARCNEILGERLIEDLTVPYFAMSTNLTSAQSIVHRRGPLRHAVRASISIPGVLPPVHDGEDLLIDGGILNNVPDDVMRDMSAGGPVVAVDVGQKDGLSGVPGATSELSGWRVLWRRFNPFATDPELPGILSVLQRSIEVRGVAARLQPRPESDLYLALPLSQFGLLQFDALDEVADRGYELTRDALQEWWRRRAERVR